MSFCRLRARGSARVSARFEGNIVPVVGDCDGGARAAGDGDGCPLGILALTREKDLKKGRILGSG